MSGREVVRLGDAAGRRVVLAGLGRDVTALLPHLVDVGPSALTVLVDDPATAATELPVRPRTDPGARPDLVIRAPGFSPYDDPVAGWEAAGTVVTTPMAVWLADAAATDLSTIGITGTKGKSTTADLAWRLLGPDAHLAGNIGVGVWDLGPPATVTGPVVLEVSSYMARDLMSSPRVGGLTNLMEDHLSWHGSVDRYRSDKLRLFRGEPPPDEVWVGTGPIPDELPTARLAPPVVRPHLSPQVMANLSLAVALAGFPADDLIDEVLAAWQPLPGRGDVVPCRGRPDLTFVDDVLASNPGATAATVRRFAGRPLTVLVGGADRGVEPTALAEAVMAADPPVRMVALPDSGDDLVAETGGEALGAAADVAAAVAVAVAAARPGEVICLSPAAPTRPADGTYVERSASFRAAISSL